MWSCVCVTEEITTSSLDTRVLLLLFGNLTHWGRIIAGVVLTIHIIFNNDDFFRLENTAGSYCSLGVPLQMYFVHMCNLRQGDFRKIEIFIVRMVL